MFGRDYRIAGNLDNTEIVMRNTFWIGTYPGLSTEHLDYVVSKIEEYFGVNF